MRGMVSCQALLVCATLLLWAAVPVRAEECAPNTRCAQGAYPDLIELQDGTSLCGLMVLRDEGRKVIVITETETKTVTWDQLRCIGTGAGKSRAEPVKPAAAVSGSSTGGGTPAAQTAEEREDTAWGGLALEWELRAVGAGLLKRYEQNGATAGSWSAGGGIGAGAALRYQSKAIPKAGGVSWYTVDLGLGINMSFESWHQLGGQSATLIHQDIFLALGGRMALGPTRSTEDGLSWSGAMLGLAWLPTYSDFYGARIDGRSRINPAGVRLTVDIGGASGPHFGHSPMLRLAVAYLPYTSRLPSAFWLSAGVLFY
jgi:hypothetical protein